MKKALFSGIASLFLGLGILNAQEAAPVAEAAPAAPQVAEAAAPAFDAEAWIAALPDVLATANDQPLVRKADIANILNAIIQQAKQGGEAIPQEMLQPMVAELTQKKAIMNILLAKAKAAGIVANTEAVQNQLAMVKAQFAQESENAFAERLKEFGMTEEDFLNSLVEEDICQQYSEILDKELAATVKEPTDEEAKEIYDSTPEAFQQPATMSAAHILVSFPNSTPTDEEKAEALAKIQEIRGKLATDGSNFAEIAKEFSDCPSKEFGGELGEFAEGDMVPAFEAAVKAMKEGEISAPVETEFGYHLIKCGPVHNAYVVSFEEAAPQIKGFLKQQAMAQAAQQKLKQITDEVGLKFNMF